MRRIPTYIAPPMKLALGLVQIALASLLLFYGCDGNGVGPSDEDLPILSSPQGSFDDRDKRFYVAVTVTLPAGVTSLDSSNIWTEMFLVDTTGVDSPLTQINLVDDGSGGDILPQDGVYARKFSSPLAAGSSGTVYFDFYALVDGDTSMATDTLHLVNLRPVILSVSGSDTLIRPPEGFITLDTLRAVAADPDGLDDIRRVGFTVLKPDSTLANQGQPIYLADNGDRSLWGDLIAGDGTYSIIIRLESTNDPGRYVYRFTAEDYSGAVSDTVYHPVVVQ
ncbi:MAG: hypothetical protein JSW54_07715 [Fidelibacterota bacterium]|nr:MAG: hypothetical protein JSW54_07715 [Candidatus Neomarinimicrobiota bacterium]